MSLTNAAAIHLQHEMARLVADHLNGRITRSEMSRQYHLSIWLLRYKIGMVETKVRIGFSKS